MQALVIPVGSKPPNAPGSFLETVGTAQVGVGAGRVVPVICAAGFCDGIPYFVTVCNWSKNPGPKSCKVCKRKLPRGIRRSVPSLGDRKGAYVATGQAERIEGVTRFEVQCLGGRCDGSSRWIQAGEWDAPDHYFSCRACMHPGKLSHTYAGLEHLRVPAKAVNAPKILELQGGRCAWCENPIRPDERFEVDHDHRVESSRLITFRSVRGVTHPDCNHRDIEVADRGRFEGWLTVTDSRKVAYLDSVLDGPRWPPAVPAVIAQFLGGE